MASATIACHSSGDTSLNEKQPTDALEITTLGTSLCSSSRLSFQMKSHYDRHDLT
jgi:hypothetical protein